MPSLDRLDYDDEDLLSSAGSGSGADVVKTHGQTEDLTTSTPGLTTVGRVQSDASDPDLLLYIVAGICGLVLVLVALLAFILVRRRRSHRDNNITEENKPANQEQQKPHPTVTAPPPTEEHYYSTPTPKVVTTPPPAVTLTSGYDTLDSGCSSISASYATLADTAGDSRPLSDPPTVMYEEEGRDQPNEASV